jgi:hypothetical protein
MERDMPDAELEAMKAELRQSLDVVLPAMEPSPELHDGCACMGPREGRELCPCAEREIALDYLKGWRKMLDSAPPNHPRPSGKTR